jgi:hypothetical protein
MMSYAAAIEVSDRMEVKFEKKDMILIQESGEIK